MTDKIGFNGYIDGWLKDKDGNNIIEDWKTGTKNAQKHRKNTRQIQVYAYLLRLIGEKPDIGRVGYVEMKEFDKYGKSTGRPLEVDVDISVEKCEKVFNKMFGNYVKKIKAGIGFSNFSKCCAQNKKTWCEYARMCDVINNVRVDSKLLKQTLLKRI